MLLMPKRERVLAFIVGGALLASLAAAATYDKGRLQTDYFSSDSMTFVETGEIDYLWVKEGAKLDGRSFHFVEWPDTEFLGPKAGERDEDDVRLARQMRGDMHISFAEVWDGLVGDASTSDGEIKVEGRIVDCSTGSRAAKLVVGLGAGAGSTVIDLKFTDTASGEVIAAIHHRVVSGTSWSTTNSKFYKWVKKAGQELGSRGFQGAYAQGERRSE
jgi:hypothetical protein